VVSDRHKVAVAVGDRLESIHSVNAALRYQQIRDAPARTVRTFLDNRQFDIFLSSVSVCGLKSL
jgi:hypothetical protein